MVVVLSASIGSLAVLSPSRSNPQLSRVSAASSYAMVPPAPGAEAAPAAAPVDVSSPEAYVEPKGETYMNMPLQGGELFCWALMLPSSYEPVLLAMQFAERQSLFGCDQAAVYSNKTMQIGPDFISIAVDVNLQCSFGGEFKTALSKEIFD